MHHHLLRHVLSRVNPDTGLQLCAWVGRLVQSGTGSERYLALARLRGMSVEICSVSLCSGY